MILPLLLLILPTQGVTPVDFDVLAIGCEASADGQSWYTIFSDPQGTAADLGNQEIVNVSTIPAPSADWHHVRVSLGTQIMVQAEDPCGSGQTIYHFIDLTGDPIHDPDGDGVWTIYYATITGGGTYGGDGSAESPRLLPDSIKPPSSGETRIRLLVRTTEIVRCENGETVVDPPDVRVVCDDGDLGSSPLYNQRFQVAGIRSETSGEWPVLQTVQGVFEFHGDGTWNVTDGLERTLDVATADSDAHGVDHLGGLWGTRQDGRVWLIMDGYPGILAGHLGQWDKTLALTSLESSTSSMVLFGHKWMPSVPANPYQHSARFLHYGAELDLFTAEPLVGDLVWSNAWGKFVGTGGSVGFEGPVNVTEMRSLDVFEPGPHQVIFDNDLVAMPMGAMFNVLTTGGEMDFNVLDWGRPHHGSLSADPYPAALGGSDGRFALLGTSGSPAYAHGLTLTLGIPESASSGLLNERYLRGTYFSDRIEEGAVQTSSGRFTLFFASGGSLMWYQDGLVDGELAQEQFSGSWSIDNQGQVSVDVPGKGRYRGQVSDTPDVLGLVASPDGSGGVNDRFIGLLLWP